MPDAVHTNPPWPANTTIVHDAEVTPPMSAWAVAVLHDPAVALFGVVRRAFDGVALVARKEWHPPDFQNHVWHTGVTLYRELAAASSTRGIVQAYVGARGTDSLSLIDTPEKARALKAAGIEFALQYLGTVTAAVVDIILEAGLAFMPVTRANRFDGGAAVAALAELKLPAGCTTWLDVEGVANIDPAELKQKINAWALAVSAAGFEPGLYVGAQCPLTSAELYQLKVTRYWKSQSRILDRNGQLAEPSCGWCLIQTYPSVTWSGILVDVDIVQQDYQGRLPSWAVKATLNA